MTDFLDHLLLRSTEQPLGAILQPRLPALFEPIHNTDEPFGDTDGMTPAEIVSPKSEVFASPVKSESSGSTRQPLMPEAQPTRPSTQPVREYATEEPQRTILPRAGSEVIDVKTEKPVKPFPTTEKQGDMPRSASPNLPAVTTPIAREPQQTILPPEQSVAQNAKQTEITNTIEKPVERILQPALPEQPAVKKAADRTAVQNAVEKTKLIPAPISQPVFTEVCATGKPQLQSPPAQEPQPVVEIHIGRVEVRAIPVPHSSARGTAKKTTTTSLDEYLRARSGGKR